MNALRQGSVNVRSSKTAAVRPGEIGAGINVIQLDVRARTKSTTIGDVGKRLARPLPRLLTEIERI